MWLYLLAGVFERLPEQISERLDQMKLLTLCCSLFLLGCVLSKADADDSVTLLTAAEQKRADAVRAVTDIPGLVAFWDFVEREPQARIASLRMFRGGSWTTIHSMQPITSKTIGARDAKQPIVIFRNLAADLSATPFGL